MSHGITQQDAGFLMNEAWHQHSRYEVLGRAITEPDLLSLFSKYTFENLPTTVQLPSGEVVNTGKFARVCLETEALGYTGASSRFHVESYEDYFLPVAQLGHENGFEVLSAGTLDAGVVGFMSLKSVDSEFKIPGYSSVTNCFNLAIGNDGKISAQSAFSTNIQVCKNTMRAFLLGESNKVWKIRNTTNSGFRLEEARRQLEATLQASNRIEASIDRMINAELTAADYRGMVSHIISDGEGRPTEEGRGQTMYDNKFDALVKAYDYDSISGLPSSVFRAIQAVQEFSQHHAPLRKDTDRVARSIETSILGQSDMLADAAAQYLEVHALVAA